MKKIVLCGGGTAGHVVPNIALLPLLYNHFDEIHYIASEGGIEKKLLAPHKKVQLHSLECTKLVRSFTLKNLAIPFKLLKSVRSARALLRHIKPNVIFSKGGFAALPVVMAAGSVPVVAHESDLKMGLANRLTAKKCAYICTTFEDTAKRIRNGVFTGSPLREQIFFANPQKVLNECAFSQKKPVLLIMGGSLGAQNINKVVYSSLPTLCARFNVIHLVGEKNLATAPKRGHSYVPFGFREDIGNFLAAASYVVSRAGSNALCELLALKKPVLAIPLSRKASRGDQIQNAQYYAARDLLLMLKEESLSEQSFLCALQSLTIKKAQLTEKLSLHNIANANQKIMDIILSCRT